MQYPVRWTAQSALSPAYILTISPRFTVAPPVFTQRLRSRLLIRRIVFRRRCVNTHGATVNRGEIVSMYAGLYTLPPGRPVHSDTNSASLGSILATQQLRAKTIHSHFHHCLYQVLIYTAEWTGASWSERKCPNFKTVAKGIRTRALSIASPTFYRWTTTFHNCPKHYYACLSGLFSFDA